MQINSMGMALNKSIDDDDDDLGNGDFYADDVGNDDGDDDGDD